MPTVFGGNIGGRSNDSVQSIADRVRAAGAQNGGMVPELAQQTNARQNMPGAVPMPDVGISGGSVQGFVDGPVDAAVRGRNISQAELLEQRSNSTFDNYGDQQRFAGNDPATGDPQFEPVTAEDFDKSAEANQLPDTAELLNDPSQLFYNQNPKVSVPVGEEESVLNSWKATEGFFRDTIANNPGGPLQLALNKVSSQVGFGDLGVVASLAGATTIKAQHAYTVGKEDSSESIYGEDQREDSLKQVGLTPDNFMTVAGGAVANLLALKGVNVSDWTDADRMSIGGAILESKYANGDLVETTNSYGKVKLTPSDEAIMSPLGDMGDKLMGTNLRAGVSAIPLNAAVPIGVNSDTSQISGNNAVKGEGLSNNINELAKDHLGHMPMGIDEIQLKLSALQIVDLMGGLQTPVAQAGDPEGSLQYNKSKFNKAYKMDKKSIVASYRLKLFNLSDQPTYAQKEAVAKEVNDITRHRMTNLISRLNEQIKLTSDGYGSTLNKFYNSYSTGGMNGRMLPNTFNGNYTGDKEVARNVHKFKVNPMLSIKQDTWDAHNKAVNSAAKNLLKYEGDNVGWEKALDAMDEKGGAMSAEISFRIVMAGKALNDYPALRKKILGSSKVRNLSMTMLYEAYEAINKRNGDSLYMIRQYASQGERLSADLRGAPDVIGTLAPLAIDGNSTANDKMKMAAEGWGQYSTNQMDSLVELTNERGEMRQDLSLRLNAMNYMKAYNGDGPANFELDFEVEMDATQSGPLLQSVIAPSGKNYADVQDRLGFAIGTTEGDLRDFAQGLFEDGTITDSAFEQDAEANKLWRGFMETVFQDKEDGGIARELILKQPQMQYFYGKPANMFMDLAAEFEANFGKKLDALMPDRSVAQRREDIRNIIQTMLTNPMFDVQYSKAMKHMALMLAATNSGLQLEGPHGPIDLSIGSMQHVIDKSDELTGTMGREALRLQMIEVYNAANDETKSYNVKTRSYTPAAAKPVKYNPLEPVSGSNMRTGPGKKLVDSMGVLLIHHLDASLMNFTIAHVNRNRPRHNPYPAKVIYDAIITNGAGFLRYGHTYNNVAIPSVREWNLQKAVNDAAKKASQAIKKESMADPQAKVNMGVIEGQDGQSHPVSFHAAVTGWLDNAVAYENPQRSDYENDAMYSKAKDNAKSNSPTIAYALNQGYIKPEFAESYTLNGVINPGEALVLNAGERTNMQMSMNAYSNLLARIDSTYRSRADNWSSSSAKNRENQAYSHKGIIAHLTM